MDNFYYNFVTLGISELGFIPWLAIFVSLGFIIFTFMYSIFYFIRWIIGYKVNKEIFILAIGCIPFLNLICIGGTILILISTYIFKPINTKLENIREKNIKRKQK